LVDLSKCQCEKPGLCPVFKRVMGSTPPNWRWCQDASGEDRQAFFKITSKSIPDYYGATMEEIDFSKCHCSDHEFCPIFNQDTSKNKNHWLWCRSVKKEERMANYKETIEIRNSLRNAIQRGKVETVLFKDTVNQPSSKYAVCVIAANDSAARLLDITRLNIQEYAKKCGADYIELTGDQHPDWPMANKYRVYQVASLYEKTLYLDCDIIVKCNTPNIFEITPDDKISACSDFIRFKKWGDIDWVKNEQELIVHKMLGGKHENIKNGKFTPTEMLNGGFLVIPKSMADYYKQPTEPYPRKWCFDQNYLTLTLPASKLNLLPPEFNNTAVSSQRCPDITVCTEFWNNLETCYVIHVNGVKNHQIRENILSKCIAGDFSKDVESIQPGTFITNERLLSDTARLASKLPKIRGVLGIPRSGMLPASIIATLLSVPLYSISDGKIVLLSEKSVYGGSRMLNYNQELENVPILVVDDTSYSGAAMNNIKLSLKAKYPNEHFLFTTIYHEPTNLFVSNNSTPLLDIYNNALSFPHILEWNFFNAHPTMFGMFDLDGVFCPDCTEEIDADEQKYIQWMRNVPAFKDRVTKLFPCMAICTGRPEAYREETENWLQKNNIKFNKLIMFPGTKSERDGGAGHAINVANFKRRQFETYKGLVTGVGGVSYMSNVNYFIESCPYQSRLIAQSKNTFGWVVSINEKKTYACGLS